MNIIRVSRNVTIIALLLSLLFHVGTILYVFMQQTGNPLSSHIEQQEQAEELKNLTTHDPWVETKARAGNFGSPVFFRDEPETQQQSSFAEATADTSKGTPAETEEEQSFEQRVPALQDSPDTDETLPEEEFQVPLAQDITVKNAISMRESVQAQPTPSVRKRAPHKKRTQTKKRSSQQNNPIAPTGAQKPPLSLAQLTQGFLHHLEEGGTYGVSMIGKKNGIPSEDQLKYERYLQKLGWCLQNSYNINNDRCPAVAQDTIAHILLVLNRDGTMKHLNVAKSSGNIHLDQFTLFVFRDASTSFPPLPQYLPDDPFAITYVISINAT